MSFVGTVIFDELCEAWLNNHRHIWLEGGTAASKTYSVLQFLIYISMKAKKPLLISIVSETIPHLKRGCIRDFKNILGDDYNEKNFNRTDLVYSFGNAQIEFFGADAPDKVRGPRRDILFINEANNIPYDTFRELDSRTKIRTICDWNPVSEFWFHLYNLQNDGYYIHATYKDAKDVLPQSIIDNILKMGERDPNWANVYLYGRIGKIQGLVYPTFSQVETLPNKGFSFYGLDFGYSSDPSALVKNVIVGDELYSKEILYESGLTNQELGAFMKERGVLRGDLIVADSAEPKSIEELCRMGFNVKPCSKGKDSVEYGHQKVRQYKQFWTSDSLNCIKEQRNFRYLTDKDGRFTTQTTHTWSHGMDARRYGVTGVTSVEKRPEIITYDAMKLVNLEL